MNPCLEILPTPQRKIYPYLRAITDMGFVLFGGTAIALHLGHRQSIDFDFFHSNSIQEFSNLLKTIKNIKVDKVLQNSKNTLVYQTDSGVKLSFFGTLDFVSLSKPILSSDNILNIADLDSLLITKLKAICDRAEFKDYFDIAAILSKGNTDLKNALNRIEDFFGNDFAIIDIVKALTYFEDGDLHRLSDFHKEILIKSVADLKINTHRKR